MVKATPLQNFSGKAVVSCQGYFKVVALVLGTKVCKFESYLRHKIEVSECYSYFIIMTSVFV